VPAESAVKFLFPNPEQKNPQKEGYTTGQNKTIQGLSAPFGLFFTHNSGEIFFYQIKGERLFKVGYIWAGAIGMVSKTNYGYIRLHFSNISGQMIFRNIYGIKID
jgi:hypothetical protein